MDPYIYIYIAPTPYTQTKTQQRYILSVTQSCSNATISTQYKPSRTFPRRHNVSKPISTCPFYVSSVIIISKSLVLKMKLFYWGNIWRETAIIWILFMLTLWLTNRQCVAYNVFVFQHSKLYMISKHLKSYSTLYVLYLCICTQFLIDMQVLQFQI